MANRRTTLLLAMNCMQNTQFLQKVAGGHLGKRLIAQYSLDQDADPQHYGIGIKELWEIDPAKHKPGLVMHGSG